MSSVQTERATSTGDVLTTAIHSRVKVYIAYITLTAGSDAATVVVREGGSGGTIIQKIAAIANDTKQIHLNRESNCSIHVTLTGTSPECIIGWK